MTFNERTRSYIGTITWRGGRLRMALPLGSVSGVTRKQPSSPIAYDEASRAFFAVAWRRNKRLPIAWENGRILIRRTFQAPCPILE